MARKRKEKRQKKRAGRKDKRKKKRADRRKNRKPKMLMLKPFKRRMMKSLDARQITYDKGDLKNIAENFFNAVVKGKHTFSLHDTQANGAEGEKYGVVGITVEIIAAIIKFFIDLIKRKKKGEPLTTEEKEMADEAEQIDEDESIDDVPKDPDEEGEGLSRIFKDALKLTKVKVI